MSDVGSANHLANVRKPIFTASLGKGRRELSAEQKEILQNLIGRELELMGYPPATD